MEGTIKKLVMDRGFGFITPKGERTDVFFHSSHCDFGIRFDDLRMGQQVIFDLEDDPKRGTMQAVSVRLNGDSSQAAQSATVTSDSLSLIEDDLLITELTRRGYIVRPAY